MVKVEYEELQCGRCREFWWRPVKGGRKPKLCPRCVAEGTPPVRTPRASAQPTGTGESSVPEVPDPDAVAARLTDIIRPKIEEYERRIAARDARLYGTIDTTE